MRYSATTLILAVVGVSLGCAGTVESTRATPTTEIACPCARPYATAEMNTILRMRDNGDGLRDVAAVVGGTRTDVRTAERLAKSRRRGVEGIADCPPCALEPAERTRLAGN
jgi:hypothetical protein